MYENPENLILAAMVVIFALILLIKSAGWKSSSEESDSTGAFSWLDSGVAAAGPANFIHFDNFSYE